MTEDERSPADIERSTGLAEGTRNSPEKMGQPENGIESNAMHENRDDGSLGRHGGMTTSPSGRQPPDDSDLDGPYPTSFHRSNSHEFPTTTTHWHQQAFGPVPEYEVRLGPVPPITYSLAMPHHPGMSVDHYPPFYSTSRQHGVIYHHHVPSSHHGHSPYPWGTPFIYPTEYISNIQPNDVLSGRGGATNSHSGNRAFRSLVKCYQNQYLKAKKKDKPAVAASIVEQIRGKGGRFLKRADTAGTGQVLWVDIGDEKAKEKTCQALREGAPELRKRKSTDDSSTKSESDCGITHPERTSYQNALCTPFRSKHRNESQSFFHRKKSSDRFASYDRFIRPIPEMVVGRAIPDTIPIDELQPKERDLYFFNFIPPDSST